MKIAVTGACGFIGRHVVAEALRRGHDVVAVDRRGWPADSEPAPTEQRLVELCDEGAASFEGLGRPDSLIHLAWGGLPNYRSLHHFEVELPLQYAFLGRMVRGGLGSMVVTGTCFEYGMQSGRLGEDALPLPANPYGLAKHMLRLQLEYLRAAQPFRFCWARLFYLHGDGQAPGSLIPLLEKAVARGDKTFGMSGGEQLRDYLHVSEVAAHLVAMAAARADGGVVNVCSGQPVSVRRFVESIVRERGWTIGLDLGVHPYPDYEPLAFWGDRSRLDQLLGREHAPVAA